MKQSSKRLYFVPGLITLFCFPVFFSSCDSYNFSQPQPVDQKNIYEFPQSLTGKWIDKEEDDDDFFLISKTNVMLVHYDDTARIVCGAWPKLSATGDFLYPPDGEGFKRINYDSLKRPVDTVDKFLLSGQYIYEITTEKYLRKGQTYSRNKDTINFLRSYTFSVDLGKNAFLRELRKNFYVLNINNAILGEENYASWWQLFLLEKKEDNSLSIWECTHKTGELPSMFYARPSQYDIFYFNCEWTTDEMLRLVKEGYFEVRSNNYRVVK